MYYCESVYCYNTNIQTTNHFLVLNVEPIKIITICDTCSKGLNNKYFKS